MSAPPELHALQGFLQDALRRETSIPDDPALAELARLHVRGNERLSPAEQADIYRRQFWLRHHDALLEDYPGLAALIGDQAFGDLVRAYLAVHPPARPSLRDLGEHLVRFTEGYAAFPPALRAAALEMVRYENALVDLFDGAEPPPLDAGALAAIPEDAWDRAQIVLHPLLVRVRLAYPVHRYRVAAEAGEGGTLDPTPVHLVVYRHENVIHFEELEPAAFDLLEALAQGEALVPACDRIAAALDPTAAEALGARVGPWFQQWTAWRWIVGVEVR